MGDLIYTVRPATLEDAEQIAAAHLDSIHSLGPRAYGPDVIAVWGAPRDGSRYRQAMHHGELFFVAATADQVLGFSAYRLELGQHRTAIYVRGSAARRGVGMALFAAAEGAARERGAPAIHVDASLVAVEFYARQGFLQLGTGEHRLGGIAMNCVFMRKPL